MKRRHEKLGKIIRYWCNYNVNINALFFNSSQVISNFENYENVHLFREFRLEWRCPSKYFLSSNFDPSIDPTRCSRLRYTDGVINNFK